MTTELVSRNTNIIFPVTISILYHFILQMQKTCFNILKRLVDAWGGKNGLPGFSDFMYEYIVPACFMAPLKPTFDLGDAQTVLVSLHLG